MIGGRRIMEDRILENISGEELEGRWRIGARRIFKDRN